MSQPKKLGPPPTATASSTDDFAADLAALDAGGDDFGADLAALDEAPEKPDGSAALAASGGLAGLSGLIAAARAASAPLANLTTQVAEPAKAAIGFVPRAASAAEPVMRTVASPMLARAGALAGRFAAPINVGLAGVDYLRGKRSAPSAIGQAAGGYAAKHFLTPDRLMKGAQVVQRVATPVAQALGGAGALTAAGGLAGLAGSAGFLGALEHDANRDVPMDYTKRNLTEDIARALSRTGATDVQMDDPSHPAFRPDDSETVTAPGGGYTAALLRLLRAG
jgi:hypothetical protein